jgi:hypothetical protein
VPGARADGHEHVDAGAARVGSDLGVEARLLGPELEHVAEDGDAAPGRGRGEVVEGGAHRHRVGVVAVVDDDDATRELEPLAAKARERHAQLAVRLDADRPCCRERRERVAAHVGARERQPQAVGERVDVTARSERDGGDVVAAVGLEQRLAGRHDRRASRAQSADELGLGGGDRLDRAHQLEVDRAIAVMTATSGSAIAAS